MQTIENIINRLKDEQAFNEEAIAKEVDQITKSFVDHINAKYEMEKKFAAEFHQMFQDLITNVRNGYDRSHFDAQEPPMPAVVQNRQLSLEEQEEILGNMQKELEAHLGPAEI